MATGFFGQFKQITKTIAMILSWTIFALLLLIIGFLVYYLVCTNIYASKGEKFEPKFSLYTIVSPSMEPNIKVYDVILNTRVDDPAEIKVGDVITFISTSNISNGMTVTHRVTKIVQGPNGLEFKTKGDNNLSEDTDTAKANNVLGKVLLKIPQLGRLQFFLSSNGGWLIVIVCPALFIIVSDIFKIFKLNKAKKAISDAEDDENNEEKIKLEAFRKEEIKDSLKNKELKKANKLAEKMKNQNKINEASEIVEKKVSANIIVTDEKEQVSENNDIENSDETNVENKMVERNIDDEVIKSNEVNDNIKEEKSELSEDKLETLQDMNGKKDEINSITEIIMEKEERMFIPVIEEKDVIKENNETELKQQNKSKEINNKSKSNKNKKKNNKKSKNMINNDNKEVLNFEEYNIFGEKIKEDNIFTQDKK